MIEIDIPSIDPIQHQPKVFLGMNKRQIICAIPGAAAAVGLGLLFSKVSIDLAVLGVLIAAIPAACLGWIRPYNMPFEQYAKLVYFNMFVNPSKRIYKTDNAEDVKMLTIKEREAMEKKKQQDALNQKKNKNSKTNPSDKENKNNNIK